MGPKASLLGTALLIAAFLLATATAEAPACGPAPTYGSPPRGQPAEPVKLADAAFVRARDGAVVAMKAVSWFGVHDNASAAATAALWSSGNAAVLDLPALAYQLRAQGFNALRLPFSFDDLRAPPQSMWAKQGCSKVTLGAPPSGEASAPVAQPAGRCSWFLPDSSSLDRYLWALQWFAANGFYVLSEFRPAPGEATARNQQGFVDSWAWLWQHVRCLPNFEADLKGRVFVDLLGAPDAAGLRWEAAAAGPEGVSVPGLTELYLGAMDALWGASPGSLAFFVAGAGQGGDEKWGSGFVTDKATIAVNDYSDPNPFFTALLAKPYRGAVVIAPSVYSSAAPAPPQSGPDPITGAPPPPPAWPAGAGPLKIMDTTFSYLAKEGYGLGADCQRFPVAVGEFASRLAAGGGELAALNAFAAHLSSVGVEYGGVGTWRFWSFDAAPASS